MDLQRVDIEHSTRTSRLRNRVLIVLADLGTAHAGELAPACRISTQTLRHVMYGQLPHYSPERSLIALGLVAVVPHSTLDVYAITEAGRDWARQGRHRARRAREAASALP